MAKKRVSPLRSPQRRPVKRATRAPSRAKDEVRFPVVALPTRTIALKPRDIEKGDRPSAIFQRAAMQWSYIVRNRRRWSGRESLVREQASRTQRLLLEDFNIGSEELSALAKSRVAQVVIPYQGEEIGWEMRVFPWEFVLSVATRGLRRGEPLTIMRRLARATSTSRQPVRHPKSILYVESAPGPLAQEYSFDSERALVQATIGSDAVSWHELKNPTRQVLRKEIVDLQPDLVHLAGFDSHQGLQVIRTTESEDVDGLATTTDPVEPNRKDGYILAGDTTVIDPVDAEDLARIVCAASRKPILVSCNLWNSASRICPMLIAAGASAAIGFQDSFADELVESFFGNFYRHLRHASWTLRDAFIAAWEKLRQHPTGLVGTGIVLWSEGALVAPGSEVESTAVRARRQRMKRDLERDTEHELDPAHEKVTDIVTLTITPIEELNYSLLHNRRPLFEDFKLVKRKPGRMTNLSVTVDLNAGSWSFPFRRHCDMVDELDLKSEIHASLTADLVRSVRESVNTSLFVEITWHNQVLYRNTHRVRLLPPDQWRDTNQDRIWLPCFVLPRDPAVSALVEKAHRYVRVLRDDPGAGFDGYQSVDADREDPTEDVDLQVQALWSAILHEWQLGYINPPPTYSRGLDSQRLRTPSAVLADRSGTCIDLTLLVAACLELVDIYPVIFLLDGHAFPGYWRSDEAHEQFLQVQEARVDAPVDPRGTVVAGTQAERWVSGRLAYDEIVRQVDQGNLVPIESVKLTENCGFWAAVEAGKENLRPKREFHSMIDVLSARFDRVTPLPLTESRL